MGVQKVQAACDVQRDLVAPVVPLQLPKIVGGDGSAQVATCTAAGVADELLWRNTGPALDVELPGKVFRLCGTYLLASLSCVCNLSKQEAGSRKHAPSMYSTTSMGSEPSWMQAP